MQSDAAQLTLQDQLLTWFEKNKRQLLIGAVVIALIGAGAGIYIWHQNEVQADASEALSKFLNMDNAGGAQPGATAGLLKVAADYPGSDAAKRAVLLAAGDYFAQGSYKDAQAQFEKFLRDYRESSFADEALLGVAACKDAQGNTDEAIAAYKDIVERHSGDSVAPQARFALGRLYESQHKPEMARDLYMQVAQADPNGTMGSEAGMRLAELYSKNPGLVPGKSVTASPAMSPRKP